MPDTLDSLAQRLAPTRATTSYFDPAAGQSVMSRYANAGRRVADSQLVADAGSRLLRTRGDRLALRDRQIAMDRDEEDFNEKQAFKIERGRFLENIASIDPNAEDFDDQLSRLYTTLPQAAMDDDAVVDLIAAKRATATDLRNERQLQTRRDEEQANRMALMRERYANDPRLATLTAEERDRFYSPEGEFDSVGAAQLAYQKSRQDKKTDQLEVAATKRQWKLEDAKDDELSPANKELKALAKEHTTGDSEAFPGQVQTIRAREKFKGKSGKALEDAIKKEPDYQEALKYDSNKFVSELESARKMKKEDYVAKGGSSPASKAKRATVWDAANVGAVPVTPAPPPQTPVAPVSGPTIGTEEDGYVFQGGDPADPKNWKSK